MVARARSIPSHTGALDRPFLSARQRLLYFPPMSTLLRFLQFFSLGTWVGSIVFFGAVVAPGAFTVLSNRDQAGALVGLALAVGLLTGLMVTGGEAGCSHAPPPPPAAPETVRPSELQPAAGCGCQTCQASAAASGRDRGALSAGQDIPVRFICCPSVLAGITDARPARR